MSYKLHKNLLDTIGLYKKSFVVLGRMLGDIKRNEAYKDAVGEGIDTWSEYVTQPEIGLSVSEANRLIQLHDEFIDRLGFSEEYISQIPVKNLYYLLPIVKNMSIEDNIDDLLESARNLKQKDFKENIYDIKTEDKGERTYEYLVMQKCKETGSMSKVHGIESDDIKSKLNL